MKKDDPKKNKLRIFRTLKDTIADWYKDFNNYSKLVLIVAIPVAILTIIQADGNLADFGLVMGFALAFMSLAVIEYGSNKDKLENKKISTAYTSGSGRFLQFMGVFFVMVLFSVPAVASISAILTAIFDPQSSSLLVLATGLLGVFLSIFLLTRFSLAQVLAVGERQSVYNSFIKSQKITKGNRFKVFFGFFVIFFVIIAIAMGIAYIMGIRQSINENIYLNYAIYVIEVTVFLPIFYIYQIRLVEELNG